MMFTWKPEMIRFMRDASEYGDYNRALTDTVMKNIAPDSHVCDAGCGLGYLSLELARRVRKVSAVDINPEALKVLSDNCVKYGISNISVICGDYSDLEPEKRYDAMVFCFCGELDDILTVASKQCSGPVFIIKRNNKHHSFSVADIEHNCEGYGGVCSALLEKGIPFKTWEIENDFGQPFRNLEDARLFYEIYSHDEDKSVITDSFIRGKLMMTGRSDYPWYLPNLKTVGIVMVDSGNLRGPGD